MLLLCLAGIFILILCYKLFIEPIRFWEKLGVRHSNLLKHFYFNWLITFRGESAAYLVDEMYYAVPNSKFHGCHQFNVPNLILKTPDLIKQIAIKDFDHFVDRKFTFADENEPILGKNLLNLKGQQWREMRAILSPSFTTNKMRTLFKIMDNIGIRFVEYFVGKNEDIIKIDMQEVFTRYTNDVIASSVFGADVDSLKEPNNEFYLRGKEATDLTSFSTTVKLMTYMSFPKLYKMLRWQLLPEDTTNFFINLVNDTMKLREEGKIVQSDVIQLLIEAQKEYELQQKDQNSNSKTRITTEHIMGQAFVFFFGGFESVARTLCFLSYELSVNQEVQQKLRSEIAEVNRKCGKKITYDDLMEMKYMDMVVSEALRKYPIQIATDRICTKAYTLETNIEGEQPIHIPVGTAVIIPIYSIHRDPLYFPNPEKFDPERFSDERRSEIQPYAYQPFSIGPRTCIGSRFALMETKLIFFHLLSHFEMVPIEKTVIPLVYKKTLMTLSSEYGFWVGLKRI